MADEPDDAEESIEELSIDDVESDVDLGDEDVQLDGSLSAIERKYRDQMRQIYPTKIDLPMLTLASQIDAQIDLRPDFQRRDRWSNAKRSRFIESIIMNVPVPPVFLGEEQYGKYVVLDGRQRLTAAYRFLTDKLKLTGLSVWDELNGLKYSQLKKKNLASAIERRFLPAVLLTRESSPEVKYEVFERLNTGGVPATQMEVRNAVFPGPFNAALHALSEDNHFRRLWGIPTTAKSVTLERNGLYRDMRDLEFVLRFFALSDEGLGGMSFKELLSDYMNVRNRAYDRDSKLAVADAELFRRATSNAYILYGEDAFKRLDQADAPDRRRQRSAPYADALMHALSDIPGEALSTEAARQRVREALVDLFRNTKFLAAISTGTNGDTAIKTRIKLARSAVLSALAS